MRFLISLLLAGALLVPATASANPPGNDRRQDAWALTNGASGTTVHATRESDTYVEGYRPGNGRHSVWYRWTAPQAGRLTVTVNAPSFDSVVAAYTTWQEFNNGDVVSDADTGAGDSTSRIEIDAKAGQTFHVVVDGFTASAAGTYAIATSWDTTPAAPANDDFSSAQTLTDAVNPISDWTDFSHRYATKEPGEPLHRTQGTPNKSVWFKYTAPANGFIRVVGDCGKADLGSTNTTVAVYTGATVSALSEVTYAEAQSTGQCTFRLVRFKAVAGTTYRIAVDNASADTGLNAVRLEFDDVAPKTAFEAATTYGAKESIGFTSDHDLSFESVTYECKVDGAPPKACQAPFQVAALAEGNHTLHARATDDMGNVGPWALKNFKVDKTPAVATITGGPSGPIPATAGRQFTFTSEAGATFQCRHAKYGAFTPCTSPYTLPSNLASTTWEFAVIATDPYGNAQVQPSVRAFSVDSKLASPPKPPAPPVVTTPKPTPPTTTSTTPSTRATTTAWAPVVPPRLLVRTTSVTRAALAKKGLPIALRCDPRVGCNAVVKLRLGRRVLGSVFVRRGGWHTLKLSKAGAKLVKRTTAKRLVVAIGERARAPVTLRIR